MCPAVCANVMETASIFLIQQQVSFYHHVYMISHIMLCECKRLLN